MRINSRGTARFTTVAATLLLSTLVAACGDKQSVASKSAAALSEAQRTGLPISGSAHGGHSANGAEGGSSDSMDHSNMPGMNGGAQSGMAGMDHSNMAGMQKGSMSGMSGMQHGNMQQGQMQSGNMAGMDHSNMAGMAGMNHGGGEIPPGGLWGVVPGSLVQGAPPAPQQTTLTTAPAPTTNVEMANMRPSETLRTDSLDAAAPVAVSESQKSGGDMQGMSGMSDTQPAPPANDPHAGHAMPRSVPPQSSSAPGKDASQMAPAAAVTYTCPMHPEVVSDKPGKCPICGTTLVKREKKK